MKYFFARFSLFVFASCAAFPAFAVDPQVWTVNSRADVLKGSANGVSISENGQISLAPRGVEVFKSDQQFTWASAADTAGNVYVGTGADGKVFKIDATGTGRLFADFNELNVTAVAVGNAGEVYAATSPDGKVYRVTGENKFETFFEPKEKYIWSMAFAGGSLYVGSGENGKIFRVKTAGATAESALLFDSSETHITSMTSDDKGNVIAGTDSNGLVLRISPDGKVFALFDAPLREITDVKISADGTVYALALAESQSAAAEPTQNTPGSSVVTVETPTLAAEIPAKSRYDVSAAKTVLYRISPNGGTEPLWNSSSVVGFSLAVTQNGVLIGTNDRGRVYKITDRGAETMYLQTDEGQVTSMTARGNQIFATTGNPGKLLKVDAQSAAEGTFTSAVLDAKNTAHWGRIWWTSAGNVQIQVRSGNTEKADETWEDWSAAIADQRGTQLALQKSRYFQWRATLKKASADAIPYLNAVNVSFMPRNIAPEVLSIQTFPTNLALASNPPMQIDPNIELSGMNSVVFGIAVAAMPPRKIFQRGARALQWSAEDRNGDKITYSVYFREIAETQFRVLKTGLTDNFFTFDGQSLADGKYIFKVVASDAPSNSAGNALTGDNVSEILEIDNSAPVVLTSAPTVAADKVTIAFDVSDSSNIARAEYSVNGGDWQPIQPIDGISDGPKEKYNVEIAPKITNAVVTLRAFDGNGNTGSAKALIP